jgi:DNA polymerase
MAAMDGSERSALLSAHADETARCTRCPLAGGRTHVVYGAGDPDAELMLVGEAPGFHEDRLGLPFAGQAGELLDRLLAGIGLARDAVYVCNTLKCRPPGNRDPLDAEIAACEPHLFRQIELVRPSVVATLGNFATKLLSGRSLGITRVHGREHQVTIGSRSVLLYPLFHPAAALYTPSMLSVLEEDFARLPGLIGRGAGGGERPAPGAETVAPAAGTPEPEPEPELVQLGLF